MMKILHEKMHCTDFGATSAKLVIMDVDSLLV